MSKDEKEITKCYFNDDYKNSNRSQFRQQKKNANKI